MHDSNYFDIKMAQFNGPEDIKPYSQLKANLFNGKTTSDQSIKTSCLQIVKMAPALTVEMSGRIVT